MYRNVLSGPSKMRQTLTWYNNLPWYFELAQYLNHNDDIEIHIFDFLSQNFDFISVCNNLDFIG